MNHRVVVNGLRILWVAITLWYEIGVFFSSVSSCNWPDSALQVQESSPRDAERPSHVLLVADPQILDHRSYPERGPFLTYLSRLVVDLNSRKGWWAALRKRPDVVIFLGDMMDGGRMDMSDAEYEVYYQRFRGIFRLPSDIPVHFIPGNHDVGLRSSPLFSPHARTRYQSHFGPFNSHISIANHTILLLDAPSLVEEDLQRTSLGQSFREWTPRPGGAVEFVHTIANEPRAYPLVLLNHIPLARDSFDCGPSREKGTIRPGAGLGYQNILGADVTSFLLESLHPTAIFSGDDHDYCENHHTYRANDRVSQVREISVKSISMAMGIKRPGFQLLSLAPYDLVQHAPENQPTLADVPCLLPDQIDIYLSTYIPFLLVSLVIVMGSNVYRVRNVPMNARRTRRLSSSRHRRSEDDLDEPQDSVSLLPQPVSARSPNLGLKHRIPLSFVVFGRRYRIVGNAFLCCLGWSQASRKRDFKGLWGGFLHDSRDVAMFPITLFAVISLWITFS